MSSDNLSLFELPVEQTLAPQALLLRHFALPHERAIFSAIDSVLAVAPLRHMRTPRGQALSAAMSNCGALGWISDAQGYRYSPVDPQTGAAWPRMPEPLVQLALTAADAAGFAGFSPDACLINRYAVGASMGLHVDRDERDRAAPIVSVSLGLAATFLFGGARRSDTVQRVALQHGDVVVWGGPSRLYYHGVARVGTGNHPLTGPYRFNLTFRKAA
jgi:alkylated DNA repair protein (DNA oxidative demethylase)